MDGNPLQTWKWLCPLFKVQVYAVLYFIFKILCKHILYPQMHNKSNNNNLLRNGELFYRFLKCDGSFILPETEPIYLRETFSVLVSLKSDEAALFGLWLYVSHTLLLLNLLLCSCEPAGHSNMRTMHTADFNSKHWTAAILKGKRLASDSFCDLLTVYLAFISG